MGGAPYLHTLTAEVPSAANAQHYAGIVADLANRRKVADLGTQLAALAASGADAAEVVATGRALLDDADVPGGWSPLIPLGRGSAPSAVPGRTAARLARGAGVRGG
nr:hypothetical protein GCM10020092_088730 [Actinoplanes digitatis]